MLMRSEKLEPAVDYKVVKLLTELLCHSDFNKQNPTINRIFDYVLAAVKNDKPIRLVGTQLLKPSGKVSSASLDFALSRKPKRQSLENFIAAMPWQNWQRLSKLLSVLPHAVELELFMDDSVFFLLEGCSDWCDCASLSRLETELDFFYEKFKKEAQKHFGSRLLKVLRWSEVLEEKAFSRSLEKARDLSNWAHYDNTVIIETNLEMCCDLWGYCRLLRAKGGSASQVNGLLMGRIAALAALYRCKADVALQRQALKFWNYGQASNPFWPVVLSNFDGLGYVPSIVVCD